MTNYCEYCNRAFKFRDLFDQHIITCEYFYKKRREKDRDLETFEHLPTQQELYKLVQQLSVQCCKLQKDVDRMKNTSSRTTKKSIIETLNSSTTPMPAHSFEEWVMVKREIKPEYLECVFKEDLIAGIQMYITDLVDSEKTNMPMRTFTNVIYVYSGGGVAPSNSDSGNAEQSIVLQKPAWKIMENALFERLITRVSHRFLQEYSNFQQDNMVKIYSNEDENDKNIIYMMKITGGKMSFEKRCSELKKWYTVTGNLRFPCTNPP